jgi:hypothetical protein
MTLHSNSCTRAFFGRFPASSASGASASGAAMVKQGGDEGRSSLSGGLP